MCPGALTELHESDPYRTGRSAVPDGQCLSFGKNQEQHDVRLGATLEKIRVSGATLNPEKCEFRKTKLTFLGYIIDGRDIHANSVKTSAILNMSTHTNISEFRHFMGVANQLEKYSKNIAELTWPLRELLRKKNK